MIKKQYVFSKEKRGTGMAKVEGVEYYTPYNVEFISGIKELGGRWNSKKKCWTVDAGVERKADALTEKIYSSTKSSTKTEKASDVELTEEGTEYEPFDDSDIPF